MTHVRHSMPDSGLGFQVKVLKTFSLVPSLIKRGSCVGVRKYPGTACPGRTRTAAGTLLAARRAPGTFQAAIRRAGTRSPPRATRAAGTKRAARRAAGTFRAAGRTAGPARDPVQDLGNLSYRWWSHFW